MSETQTELEKMEAEFPALSGQAFSAARSRALAAGLSVVEAENGTIYRVSPDGTRSEIKKIDAPLRVIRGTRFRLR